MQFFIRLFFLLLTVACLQTGFAQNCMVTNTSDSGPGSLRAAIECANSNVDYSNISFNIQGTSPFMIVLQSPLPDIIYPAAIDAATQPGFTEGSMVISGKDSDLNFGFVFLPGSGGSLLRGFSLTGFQDAYISIENGGNISIERNHLGMYDNGQCYFGIYFSGGASCTVINNKIANCVFGIHMNSGGGFTIEGNFIGTDISGTAAKGVYTAISASGALGFGALIKNNLIAGVLGITAGFAFDGNSIVIQNNKIGTDITGSYALGGTQNGSVQPMHAGIAIGGERQNMVIIEGNLIAGYDETGIAVSFGSRDGTPNAAGSALIKSNRIGVNMTKTAVLYAAEKSSGIGIYDVSLATGTVTFGGVTPLEGNTCGGGSYCNECFNQGGALSCRAYNNAVIKGNSMGVKSDGTSLGNTSQGRGVEANGNGLLSIEDNAIGFLRTGIFMYPYLFPFGQYKAVIRNNHVHHNTYDGINVNRNQVAVSRNHIAYNGTKAINLNYGSANEGNNGKLSPQGITASSLTVTGTAVEGDTIEAFSSDGLQNAISFVGNAVAKASGKWTLKIPSEGKYVFTATDAAGNTSELTPNLLAVTSNLSGFWNTTGNQDIASANFLGTANSSPLAFRTNRTTAMTIPANRNVGIGISSPTALLDLKKDGSTAGRNVMLRLGNSYVATPDALNEPTILFDNGTSASIYGSYGWTLGARVAGTPSYFRIGKNSGTFTEYFRINDNGNVGISTEQIPFEYKLAINGKILATEIAIKYRNDWPDYVFGKNYKLMSFDSLSSYIAENKHLPEVPSAEEVKENGTELGEMDAVLLKKIEELTLYKLEQQKLLRQLAEANEKLMRILEEREERIKKLKKN